MKPKQVSMEYNHQFSRTAGKLRNFQDFPVGLHFEMVSVRSASRFKRAWNVKLEFNC